MNKLFILILCSLMTLLLVGCEPMPGRYTYGRWCAKVCEEQGRGFDCLDSCVADAISVCGGDTVRARSLP